MDIGAWLRSLSLEQYEAAFRANKIDDTVLPILTAEDLNDHRLCKVCVYSTIGGRILATCQRSKITLFH
jgi:SAM domain (Sterile alpha motif)